MKHAKWEAFEASLTIVGDEALLPTEVRRGRRPSTPEQRQRRQERKRERLENDPAYVEKLRAYERAYRSRPGHKEHQRAWMWAHREHPQHPVASLHSLKCTGPTKKDGCVCHKITLYERVTAK